MLDLAETTEARYKIAEAIKYAEETPDGLFFRVQQEGLPDERYWSWRSIYELYADIPDVVTEFCSAYMRRKTIVVKIKRLLDLASALSPSTTDRAHGVLWHAGAPTTHLYDNTF